MKFPIITHNFQRLVKEGSFIIAGQFIAVLGMLTLVRVLTEYLDPVEYGQLALGLTGASFINQTVMGGMTNGISRFYSIAVEKKDFVGYLQASCQLMSYASLGVVVIAVVIFTFLVFWGHSKWLGLTGAVLVFSILSGYNSSLSGIQNAARQRVVVAFHGSLDAWMKILFAVGAIVWIDNSATAVVAGYIISSVLLNFSQFFFLGRLIHSHCEKISETVNWKRLIWNYAWPFTTWGGFTWAQQVSDRWALQAFSSTQEVGLYMVVFQLGYAPIGFAIGAAMSFLGPIFYQRAGSAKDINRNKFVHIIAWRITCFSLLGTGVIVILSLLLHAWIFRQLVADKYYAVSYLLPWMVLAGGVFAAGQILALKLMSEMKSSAMTVAKILTAILGVGLNVYGSSKYGLQGAVGALVAFSSTYFLWMALLAQHPRYQSSCHLSDCSQSSAKK